MKHGRKALPALEGRNTPGEEALDRSGDLPMRHPGRDAPHRKQLEYWLGHFTQFDLLTTLPNRSQFVDQLKAALARAAGDGRHVGVLLLNLDGFKALNVSLGHINADGVLKTVAARLRQCTRTNDALARLGGDEFAMILEGLIDLQGAAVAADRALSAIRQPIAVPGGDVVVTASGGIAFYPLDGNSIDTLLQHADIALSRAKERHRGTCQSYTPEIALEFRRGALRRKAAEARLASLTPREREVLDMLVAGNANKMIAYMLGTSIRTVENHRASIMDKMVAQSLPELVRMVLELDVVPREPAAAASVWTARPGSVDRRRVF